jgi:hypothetical protein
MARNVNILTSGWRATGVNVPVPQYELRVQVEYTDDAGQVQTKTGTVLFPNILNQIPPAYLAEEMKDLIVKYFRKREAIDD